MQRAEVLHRDGGILGAGGQRGGCHLEAGRSRETDVGGQVLGADGEGLCLARAVDGEFIGRGAELGKGRRVGTCGVEGEVLQLGALVVEAHLRRGHAAHAGQFHVVDAEGTDAGAPLGAAQAEGDADLARVGLRLEVGGIGLVRVAGHLQRGLVIVVLQVLDADAAQRRTVVLAALGQGREGVGLVGCHVHDLRDLAVGPAVLPLVAIHTQHVVVLVHLVAALLARDVLIGVVLVVRIHVPALDELGDILRLREVPFALEVAVLDQVGRHLAVLLAPFGLQGQVGHAEGVHGQAVAIDEHAAVLGHGIAVGVVVAVGIIEGAAVGGVGDAFLRHEHVLRVQKTHAGTAHVALEAQAACGHGVGHDGRAVVGLGAHFHGEPVVGQGVGIEALRLHRAVQLRHAGTVGTGADVLHGQRGAAGIDLDVGADVARTQDEPPGGGVPGAEVRHRDGRLAGIGLDELGGDAEAGRGADLNVLGQPRGDHGDGGLGTRAVQTDFLGQGGAGLADGGPGGVGKAYDEPFGLGRDGLSQEKHQANGCHVIVHELFSHNLYELI